MVYEDETVAPEKTLLSRRKVIGTALWAAPAITLATAAPALAAVSARTVTFGTTPSVNGTSSGVTVSAFNLTVTSSPSGATTFPTVTFAFKATIGTIKLPPTASLPGWQASVGGTNVAGGTTWPAGTAVTYTATTVATGTSSGQTVAFPSTSFTSSTTANKVTSVVTISVGGSNGYTGASQVFNG